ncbi:MAG: hypothetical protein PHR75_01525 [Sulfurovum sp.]|mgnify:CR=1 FL=1|nr:hypothetical protein [Sulfurovum sp.]MDD3602966.1 hypothetical protein [Sulfurovum sp.]
MELPSITLPAINLPFDIPLLLHPPIDHFAIALPVVVLLLELVNLVLKRRAVSVTSFLFITLMAIMVSMAYITGTTDGKEAFELLSDEGQEALKGHKTLGTYLMLMSGIVWIAKLLSMLIGNRGVKIAYMLILVLFVALILKQGKDGGNLVYVHGANVAKVQELDDEMFDMSEELDDLKAEMKKLKEAQETSILHEAEKNEAQPAQVSDTDHAVQTEDKTNEMQQSDTNVSASEAESRTLSN